MMLFIKLSLFLIVTFPTLLHKKPQESCFHFNSLDTNLSTEFAEKTSDDARQMSSSQVKTVNRNVTYVAVAGK